MTNKSIKDMFEVYRPKAKGEQNFVDKHVVIKHKDANGNGDDVFKVTNVKGVDRSPDHGYNPGEDAKVYEELEEVSESVKAFFEEMGEEFSEEEIQNLTNSVLEDLEAILAEEDEEDLQEISKNMKKRYINRASQDLEDRAYWAGRDDGESNNTPFKNYPAKKQSNRLKGISTAAKKLAKEDVINNFIDKYVSEHIEESAPLIDKLIIKLDEYLPESHIQDFVELFESLNEDNQFLFYNHIIDEQSINDVMNFIIEMKDSEEETEEEEED